LEEKGIHQKEKSGIQKSLKNDNSPSENRDRDKGVTNCYGLDDIEDINKPKKEYIYYEKEGRNNNTTTTSNEDKIDKEKEEELRLDQPYVEYKYLPRTYPEEFIDFLIDSRFYHDNNLKVAELLNYGQEAGVPDIIKILKINKPILYNILSNNPSFVSIHLKGLPKFEGGHQRVVFLSEDAKEFSIYIHQLARQRLGMSTCMKLKAAAEEIRRKAHAREKRERKLREKYEKRLRFAWGKRGSHGFSQIVAFLAKDFKKTRDEVLSDMKEKAEEEGW